MSRQLDRIDWRPIMSASRFRGKLLPFAGSIEVPIRPPRASAVFFSTFGVFASLVLAAPFAARPARAASPPAGCGDENLIAGKTPAQQRDLIGNPALVTDGNAVAEGAVWDGPAAVRLEGAAGSLTFDLGKPTQVGAFYLQADANDTYKVSGSADGQAFKALVQAANLVDRGHGMRTRTMQIEPTTIRYLRIGEGEGDGAFSISEFAAYCRPPTPFPPGLKTVEAPMAVGPKPTDERPTSQTAPAPRAPLGPLEIILGVALLALAGANAYRARQRASAPGAATAAGAPAPEASTERYFPIVLLMFLGSGCAALMYEIIWFQGLQLVLGSSAVSIAVLLGTFMAGMCLGSLGLARYVARTRHPLRIYALLEVLIAVCGLLMLAVMPLVQGIYTAIAPHGVAGLLLRGLFAAICLIPPTVMMGATLPAVARWVETTPRGVSWLGYFYGGNTIGAVVGCLVAGFYLLRVHDMPTATFVAVALNLAVAGAAYALARIEPRAMPAASVPAATDAPAPALPPDARLIYLAIGLSGMSALGAEVVWTRLFSLLLSGTTYTFSIILAVFLIGIGLGSGAGAFIARRTENARRALGYTQLLLIAAIAWTSWNITTSLPWWPVNPRLASTPWIQFQIDIVRCLWAILPAACLWGASFPLALAAVASKGQDGGVMVGRVYAANTVGAIVGALLTSLVFVGWVGTQNAERILMAMAAIAALAAFAPAGARRLGDLRLGMRETIGVLGIVWVATVLGRNLAPVPPALIGHGRLTAVEGRGSETYLYVAEGMSGSPAVSRDANGILSYHNAGKVQASSQPQDMRLQRMLGHLTTLVPANPKSVLVVACGAAVTAGAASIDPRVEHLTIAEIEPLVPSKVAKYFAEQNFNVVENPKVKVAIDDGRHFLATSNEKYDAITSDPFDPWVKGAANLYTKEFWELAKKHLNPGGVVTVWVPLYDSTMAVAKSEIATFFEAFPNGIVWGNTVRGEGYDIVLSGQVEPARIDVDAMERMLASPGFEPVARSLRGIGFDSATALLSTYGGRGPDLRPWLVGAEINRDNNLRLQFLAGFGVDRDQRMEIYRGILAYRRFPEDMFVGTPEKIAPLRATLSARSQ